MELWYHSNLPVSKVYFEFYAFLVSFDEFLLNMGVLGVSGCVRCILGNAR